MQTIEIIQTPDLRRVKALPKRKPMPAGLVRIMTEELKTLTGTQTLFPIQAQALYEIMTCGGLLAPIKVGGGKTLISLLAPYIMGCKNPLLVLPASLIERTRRNQGELMHHWKIQRNIAMKSYEFLGTVGGASYLENTKPDGIIFDEAHRVKNHKAGVTRRFTRYMHANPTTKVVAMSGTLLTDSLEDFAHLSHWALGDGSPLPIEWHVVEEWAKALEDPKTFLSDNYSPRGLIEAFPGGHGESEKQRARTGYRKRILDTEGVVCSQDEEVSCSLVIEAKLFNPAQITMQHMATLRKESLTPDGYGLTMASEMWATAQQIALGFHYVRVDAALYEAWAKTNPSPTTEALTAFVKTARPPEAWLLARKNWAAQVRFELQSSRRMDTELQVNQACTENPDWIVDEDTLKAHKAWEAIRYTVKVTTIPIWHDDSALKVCEAWGKLTKSGIIWCRHTFFAHELSRRSGWPYFANKGLDANGNHIEKAKAGTIAIASIDANCTGNNLQQFSRSLVTTNPGGATRLEQLLGRLHRTGQLADSVTYEFIVGCRENFENIPRAQEKARLIQDTLGHSQKLLLADLIWPQLESLGSHDARWQLNGDTDRDIEAEIWDDSV